jgi:hypothetical protein
MLAHGWFILVDLTSSSTSCGGMRYVLAILRFDFMSQRSDKRPEGRQKLRGDKLSVGI